LLGAWALLGVGSKICLAISHLKLGKTKHIAYYVLFSAIHLNGVTYEQPKP
jgi:hypothetical protein